MLTATLILKTAQLLQEGDDVDGTNGKNDSTSKERAKVLALRENPARRADPGKFGSRCLRPSLLDDGPRGLALIVGSSDIVAPKATLPAIEPAM